MIEFIIPGFLLLVILVLSGMVYKLNKQLGEMTSEMIMYRNKYSKASNDLRIILADRLPSPHLLKMIEIHDAALEEVRKVAPAFPKSD